MSVVTTTYLPMKPLIDWWEANNQTHKRTDCVCASGGECDSREALAKKLGIARATLHRRVTSNRLTMAEADEWVTGILVAHPSRIWPNWDRAPVQASLATRKGPWAGGRIV